jgi:hypothetical protein
LEAGGASGAYAVALRVGFSCGMNEGKPGKNCSPGCNI